MELEKLEIAVIRLLRTQSKVFYASLIIQMIRTETKEIETMGVCINNGRVYLYYNPEFVAALPVEELVAVMEHEVLHLVMEHIFRGRNKHDMLVSADIGKDGKMVIHPVMVFNIAADIAINQMIEGLPKEAQDYKKYQFPGELSAEEYYALLRKKFDKGGGGGGKGQGKGKDGADIQGGGTIDDHDIWKKSSSGSKADQELGKEIVRQMIKEAYEECQKRRGFLPGGLEDKIKEWLRAPEIAWQTLLKQYVGKTIKSSYRPSWKRSSRRFGVEQKGQIPKRTIKLGIAIDTSGSVSNEDFNEFIAEIKGIQKCYKTDITIMECDAAIAKVYALKPYSKLDTKFKGRGGTDYEPVFKKIQEEPKYRPELLVYFTDFYCTFPEKAPRFPVLWVVCTNGDKNNKPPFGAVIRMKKKAKHNPNDD